jgi:hypothetical protein
MSRARTYSHSPLPVREASQRRRYLSAGKPICRPSASSTTGRTHGSGDTMRVSSYKSPRPLDPPLLLGRRNADGIPRFRLGIERSPHAGRDSAAKRQASEAEVGAPQACIPTVATGRRSALQWLLAEPSWSSVGTPLSRRRPGGGRLCRHPVGHGAGARPREERAVDAEG